MDETDVQGVSYKYDLQPIVIALVALSQGTPEDKAGIIFDLLSDE